MPNIFFSLERERQKVNGNKRRKERKIKINKGIKFKKKQERKDFQRERKKENKRDKKKTRGKKRERKKNTERVSITKYNQGGETGEQPGGHEEKTLQNNTETYDLD